MQTIDMAQSLSQGSSHVFLLHVRFYTLPEAIFVYSQAVFRIEEEIFKPTK